MNSTLQEGPLREAKIFARAVENIFRKLVRLLLGRMTLVKLQELIRNIFVEEAELKLLKERPGKRVSLTRLALLTGLDTRTLGKFISEDEEKEASGGKESFLRELMPECLVLDYWASNSKYKNENGTPIELPIEGTEPSFESLVVETVSTRGMSPKSLLANLLESNSVTYTNSKSKIKLLNRQYLPTANKHASKSIEIALAAVGNLVDTIAYNLVDQCDSTETFIQRSNWSHRISKADLSRIRIRLRDSLLASERVPLSVLEEFEEDELRKDQLTIGFGIFYFEEGEYPHPPE